MPGLKNTSRTFSIFFDDAAISRLQMLAGWKSVLEEELDKALDIDIQLMNVAVVGAQHWKESTGELEGSFFWFVSDRMERTLGTSNVYSRRRNEGFSGMTDSLGRFYPNDPGKFFLDKGFAKASGPAKRIVTLAVSRALISLTGNDGSLSANLNKSGTKLNVEGLTFGSYGP